MKIAVLALQGAFLEHEDILHKLGADCIELRKKADLKEPLTDLSCPAAKVPLRENY